MSPRIVPDREEQDFLDHLELTADDVPPGSPEDFLELPNPLAGDVGVTRSLKRLTKEGCDRQQLEGWVRGLTFLDRYCPVRS